LPGGILVHPVPDRPHDTPAPGPEAIPGRADEHAYRRRVRSWALYDWANHAYVTVTATTFFPPFFVALAAPAFLPAAGTAGADATALARDTASNVYAFAVSFALFASAALAPLVGTWADIRGRRKAALVTSTAIGASVASLMVTLTPGRWPLALALYVASQLCVNLALGLNSSLMPHVARSDDLNRASSLGYAMGYVGGGLLLALDTALYFAAPALGIDRAEAVRLAFLTVGVWWVAFTIPMAKTVPEPPGLPLAAGAGRSGVAAALARLRHTLRDIGRYRQLVTMLVAFWLYMEGIGAIILLATAYGAALGLGTGVLTGTLLLTQFVAFPYALLFARIPNPADRRRGPIVALLLWSAATIPALGAWASRTGRVTPVAAVGLLIGDQVAGAALALLLGGVVCGRLVRALDTKRTLMLGLAIYAIIPVWGYFLRTPAEFVMVGWLVGTVQGGTQALSRSIYASLSPRAKSGEFFGLYGLFEKFAGILGPLLYALVGEISHDPRDSVASVAVFFLAGLALLSRVDVEAGSAAATAEESALEVAGAAD
jgi:UMF1 family MFS transporter